VDLEVNDHIGTSVGLDRSSRTRWIQIEADEQRSPIVIDQILSKDLLLFSVI
jgi:hypothetical protein